MQLPSGGHMASVLIESRRNHDDVIKWNHFQRYWPFVREFLVTGEFPSQRPVTRSFDVFFDLCLNKQLSKQSWVWWFETPSRPLWHHCNAFTCRCVNWTPEYPMRNIFKTLQTEVWWQMWRTGIYCRFACVSWVAYPLNFVELLYSCTQLLWFSHWIWV